MSGCPGEPTAATACENGVAKKVTALARSHVAALTRCTGLLPRSRASPVLVDVCNRAGAAGGDVRVHRSEQPFRFASIGADERVVVGLGDLADAVIELKVFESLQNRALSRPHLSLQNRLL